MGHTDEQLVNAAKRIAYSLSKYWRCPGEELLGEVYLSIRGSADAGLAPALWHRRAYFDLLDNRRRQRGRRKTREFLSFGVECDGERYDVIDIVPENRSPYANLSELLEEFPMQKLDDRERRLIYMCVVGKKQHEIARELGIHFSTVSVLLKRIVRRFASEQWYKERVSRKFTQRTLTSDNESVE